MRRLAVMLFVLGFAPSVWANSSGAPAQVSGAPGEGTCAACHGGTPNSGPGSLQVRFDGLMNWTPGQPVRVKVTLSDPNATRWGFELTARAASNPNQMAGSFRIIDNTNQLRTAEGKQWVTHTLTGTRAGTTGSSTWEVEWTPPSDVGFGDVVFYAAGNAANGNGQADLGDRIYTTAWTASPGTPVSGLTKVLPQLAFGSSSDLGNWATAVYLHNTTAAPVQATVRFFATDGSALTVPGINGSSAAVNLGPHGTGVVEVPNVGPLTQGWVQIESPEGVIGYGIFRQALQGVNPQEGVVPFSSSNSTGAFIVFDETDFVTAVAVLNPGSAPATVTVVARDDTGAEIGRFSLPLNPRQRGAFVVRDRPEMTAMRGRRGVLEFSAASGAVSVLGLRFNGLAFTSILPVER
ncbi:MAG: choice-of-anchor V domain-containing protein [Bryobacteraceae bacterium]